MRLALVGWSADSGLGRELSDAARNLPVTAVFVLRNFRKPTREDLLGSVPRQLAQSEPPTLSEMETFITRWRPDRILTWENPGSWEFPDLWERRGISWTQVVHWDWFDPSKLEIWKTADLIAPNRVCQEGLKKRYGLSSRLLPVPVDTERLPFRRRERANRFVSLYGYGGPDERRSIREIYSAWRILAQEAPPLTITAQCPIPRWEADNPPSSVEVRVGVLPEPADIWKDADIAVQPSRYEGVGLSLLEAQACGVPVLTVDAPPMNEIAPDLVVPSAYTATSRPSRNDIQAWVVSPEALACRVRELKGKDISALSERVAKRVRNLYSWHALKETWLEALA